ncbi:DUF2442 domain-containing protein [Paraburkholderia sp. JHI869]|uniref:DUF2442 domain-containing protein n=1 Tax=Paraburkholderia sp. JHI869 TaxID=3112959 RepID=UPI00317B5E8F
MALSKEEIAAAREAGKRLGPKMVDARYSRTHASLEVRYEHGVKVEVPVKLIQEFALLEKSPSVADYSEIEIWGGGYDLFFPRIEMAVSGPALLAGIFGSKAWMSMLARSMGSATSEAKARSSRENGKKGGRPPKAAATAHRQAV